MSPKISKLLLVLCLHREERSKKKSRLPLRCSVDFTPHSLQNRKPVVLVVGPARQ